MKVAFTGRNYQFIINDDPSLETHDVPDGFSFADGHRLILDNGEVRIATPAEIDLIDQELEQERQAVQNRIIELESLLIQSVLGHHIKNEVDLLRIDFTTIGLINTISHELNGRKSTSIHHLEEPEEGEEIVKYVQRTFTDRIVDGKFVGIDILFEWFDADQNVKLSKTEFKKMSQIESGEHLYKRRKRVEGYLTFGAKLFGLVDQMNSIFDITKDTFIKWLELGTDVWEQELDAAWASGTGTLFDALNVDIPTAAGYDPGTKIYHTIKPRLAA